MPAIQSLKKQLRGIRTTQKLTKAMKTISTAKFSKLNGIYGSYAVYGKECIRMLELFGGGLTKEMAALDPDAPPAIVVMAGNKGLCGSFNVELLNFAARELEHYEKYRLIACGKKAIQYFKSKNIPVELEIAFDDIPMYEQSVALLDTLLEWRKSGKVAEISVIYPQYINMVIQKPVLQQFFKAAEDHDDGSMLYVPDRRTIVEKTAKTIFYAMFYRLVLETALGAQAATLMTMRSAYDTATDYCARLEGQINRKRQSAVTADVLETATEWEEKH